MAKNFLVDVFGFFIQKLLLLKSVYICDAAFKGCSEGKINDLFLDPSTMLLHNQLFQA